MAGVSQVIRQGVVLPQHIHKGTACVCESSVSAKACSPVDDRRCTDEQGAAHKSLHVASDGRTFGSRCDVVRSSDFDGRCSCELCFATFQLTMCRWPINLSTPATQEIHEGHCRVLFVWQGCLRTCVLALSAKTHVPTNSSVASVRAMLSQRFCIEGCFLCENDLNQTVIKKDSWNNVACLAHFVFEPPCVRHRVMFFSCGLALEPRIQCRVIRFANRPGPNNHETHETMPRASCVGWRVGYCSRMHVSFLDMFCNVIKTSVTLDCASSFDPRKRHWWDSLPSAAASDAVPRFCCLAGTSG